MLIRGRFADDGSAIRVANEYDWGLYGIDDARNRRRVARHAAQRVRGGDDGITVASKRLDDAVPRSGLRERTVDKDDGRVLALWLRLCAGQRREHRGGGCQNGDPVFHSVQLSRQASTPAMPGGLAMVLANSDAFCAGPTHCDRSAVTLL
jgi:hypothetical protein